MKQKRGWKIILACFLILTVLVPGTALAAGMIDTGHAVTLTLSCRGQGDSGLYGQQYDIYRVADVDPYGELTVTKDFEAFNVNITGQNDDAWRNLASTLEGYVLQASSQGSLKPADSGRTDAQGNLTFPTSTANGLTPGLYLVTGRYFVQDGYYYEPAPFLIMLPGLEKEKNQWNYAVTASPKQESGIVVTPPSYVSRKVLKVWNDNGKEASRPKEITVHLLRDGKVYDTVKLSAASGWSWTWDKLSAGYKWNVVEEISGPYSIEITQEGITFVVKNTYEEETPVTPGEPDEPGNPDNPGTPVSPVGPGTPDGPSLPDSPSGSKLPQTGMLWWPVPALAALGMLFLGAGMIFRRRETAEENRP